MKTRNKHFCLVSGFFFLCIGFTLPVLAVTSKEQLQINVEKRIAGVISSQIDAFPDLQANRSKIISDAQGIAAPIGQMKSPFLSDDVALWIEQSIESMVTKRASLIITQSTSAVSLVHDLKDQAKKRFIGLSDSDAKVLLEKSKALLLQADAYRINLQRFIVSKMTLISDFNIDLGYYEVANLDDNNFVRIVRDISAAKSARFTLNAKTQDLVELRIDSNILSWALLREVREQLEERRVADTFSLGNILSGGFDKDTPPLVLKKFSETDRNINQLWIKAVTMNGQTAKLSFIKFHSFMYDSVRLRWNKPETQKTGDQSFKSFINFSNILGVWELVGN